MSYMRELLPYSYLLLISITDGLIILIAIIIPGIGDIILPGHGAGDIQGGPGICPGTGDTRPGHGDGVIRVGGIIGVQYMTMAGTDATTDLAVMPQ